jgi:threonine/homoserine/homoserine lactone efflux protein
MPGTAMLELLISAFLLGLIFNVTPGIVLAESIRRGMRGGFVPAFEVQIGSLVGDLTWAVLGLSGAAVLLTITWIERPLGLAGAGLLLWLAWQCVRDARAPLPALDPEGAGADGSALVVGAALSLSNPLNITYWAALGGTISALGVSDPGWTAFLIFLGGFMAASVLWCFVAAAAIAWTRRRIGPLGWFAVNLGCGVALAGFALSITWRVLVGPLQADIGLP